MCPGISGIDARCVRKQQAIEQPPEMKEYDDPAIQTEGVRSGAASHWSLRHVAWGRPGQGVSIGPEVQWRETLWELKPGKYRLMQIDKPARFGVKRAGSLLKLLKGLEKQRASTGRLLTRAILGGVADHSLALAAFRVLTPNRCQRTGMCQSKRTAFWKPAARKRLSSHPANSPGTKACRRKARPIGARRLCRDSRRQVILVYRAPSQSSGEAYFWPRDDAPSRPSRKSS